MIIETAEYRYIVTPENQDEKILLSMLLKAFGFAFDHHQRRIEDFHESLAKVRSIIHETPNENSGP